MGDHKGGEKVSFAVLAAKKGLTNEQLRRCYEEKVQLPPGTTVIRYPKDYLEDPFKNAPVSNSDTEYATLETQFYDQLKRMTVVKNEPNPHSKRDVSPGKHKSQWHAAKDDKDKHDTDD